MMNKQRQYTKEHLRGTFNAYLQKKQYLLARNSYLQGIKEAKALHQNQFLAKTSPKEIFKAMAYTKPFALQKIPPIKLN